MCAFVCKRGKTVKRKKRSKFKKVCVKTEKESTNDKRRKIRIKRMKKKTF